VIVLNDESLKISILKRLGFESVRHTDTTLFHHLINTYLILKSWNVAHYVCNAGLYHSVYGTTYNHHGTKTCSRQRDFIKEIIGEEAENLVYIFCKIDRYGFYSLLLDGSPMPFLVRSLEDNRLIKLNKRIVSDLCYLFAANWLEQSTRKGLSKEVFSSRILLTVADYLNIKASSNILHLVYENLEPDIVPN